MNPLQPVSTVSSASRKLDVSDQTFRITISVCWSQSVVIFGIGPYVYTDLNQFMFADFPRVTVGPDNPLMVEQGDTAAMLCEVSYIDTSVDICRYL